MTTLAVLAIIKQVVSRLPESTQRDWDSAIDKVEDKFKQGSKKDKATELVCYLLRSQTGLKDFKDETGKEE